MGLWTLCCILAKDVRTLTALPTNRFSVLNRSKLVTFVRGAESNPFLGPTRLTAETRRPRATTRASRVVGDGSRRAQRGVGRRGAARGLCEPGAGAALQRAPAPLRRVFCFVCFCAFGWFASEFGRHLGRRFGWHIFIYGHPLLSRAHLYIVCTKRIYWQMFSVHLVCRCLVERTATYSVFCEMLLFVPDVL